MAFNGSEPVRATTLERFALAFADCGFRRQSFFPCYGLAEATLFVSGPAPGKLGTSIEANENGTVQNLVGCGRAASDHALQIANPETLVPCHDGEEGQIWIAGPSVAQGYWQRPHESEQTFRAALAGRHKVRYLRTGDLGFMRDGELYISGRIKDLIIIRGRNYHPQDLDRALDEQVEGLRPGCNVAFSVTRDEEEALVVVAEVQRQYLREHGAQTIFQAMRRALAEECELPAAELVLVPPGAVPKTSSGKLRLQACRQAYLQDELRILARSGDLAAEDTAQRSNTPTPTSDANIALLRDALRLLPPEQRAPLIRRFLAGKLAQLLRVPESDLSPELPVLSLGLDSLQAVDLKHTADALFGSDAPLAWFLSEQSLARLAESLVDMPPQETRVSANTFDDHLTEQLLLLAQQAIWTVHQLETDSISYNLHLALRIAGELEQNTVRQTFEYWVFYRSSGCIKRVNRLKAAWNKGLRGS